MKVLLFNDLNMTTRQLFIIMALLWMSASCGNHYKYFTKDLYDDYQWSERELKRIQFYISQDIVLYRRLSGENARISQGKIRVVDGSEVEEIVIKKGTPGVYIQSPEPNNFAIAFDNRKNHYLMFGPNQKANGRFVLLAKEWDRDKGKITYGGKYYDTSNASAYAALMVDLKKAKDIKYRTKRASGRRVR